MKKFLLLLFVALFTWNVQAQDPPVIYSYQEAIDLSKTSTKPILLLGYVEGSEKLVTMDQLLRNDRIRKLLDNNVLLVLVESDELANELRIVRLDDELEIEWAIEDPALTVDELYRQLQLITYADNNHDYFMEYFEGSPHLGFDWAELLLNEQDYEFAHDVLYQTLLRCDFNGCFSERQMALIVPCFTTESEFYEYLTHAVTREEIIEVIGEERYEELIEDIDRNIQKHSAAM